METSKPKVIQGLFLYGSFQVEPGPGRPRTSQNSAHRWLRYAALYATWPKRLPAANLANVSTGGTSADCAPVQMPFSIRQNNVDH
jgi:hypothetical protein